MEKIAKNYFYNVAYQILTMIAPIVTAPYLARVLGAEKLGIYSYVNSSGNIITTISLLGIYAYGNRQTAYVRENRQALTKTFWELEITRVFLALGGTAIYFLYTELNSAHEVYFLIYYPYILAQFIDCSWLYVGMEDMKPAVMKNFVAKLVNVVGIFVFIHTSNDLWLYLMMLALTAFVANVSIYTQLYKYIDIDKQNFDLKMISTHLKGSVALFLPEVASVFYLQVDKVMLKWLMGTTNQVSYYDQAEKIVTIPLSLITAVSTVMMPRIANEFYNDNKKEIERLLFRAGEITLCMAMPLMFGIFCVARKFIPWYLGSEFKASATTIMILSPIVLMNSLAGISGKQYFTATNQVKILMKAYVTAAVMNVVINAILIPKYGYVGAAVATVISSAASVCIQYYYLLKQINLRGLGKIGLKYFVGALFMAVAIYLISRRMNASVMTTVVQVFTGITVYFIYLVLTKDDILREMVSLLKNRKRAN